MEHKNPAAPAVPQENKMGVMPVGKLLANMAMFFSFCVLQRKFLYVNKRR